jgi:hypothetical protein
MTEDKPASLAASRLSSHLSTQTQTPEISIQREYVAPTGAVGETSLF